VQGRQQEIDRDQEKVRVREIGSTEGLCHVVEMVA